MGGTNAITAAFPLLSMRRREAGSITEGWPVCKKHRRIRFCRSMRALPHIAANCTTPAIHIQNQIGGMMNGGKDGMIRPNAIAMMRSTGQSIHSNERWGMTAHKILNIRNLSFWLSVLVVHSLVSGLFWLLVIIPKLATAVQRWHQ